MRNLKAAGALVFLAAAAAAQPVVIVGTGNPAIDVPAVQAAVDHGGSIVLMGRFSFNIPPIKWNDHLNGRTILVSKPVTISGAGDQNGQMATIEGGDNPFAVDAAGAQVAILGLRFVRPAESAITVLGVKDLAIAYCRIEGVIPLPDPTAPAMGAFSEGIFLATTPDLFPPTAAKPGQPENVTGTLSIISNDMDIGGTAGDTTQGIAILSVGKSPDKEVDLYISGNTIRNVTERAIQVHTAGGRVQIERNVISTGAVSGRPNPVAPDAIHAAGPGSYLIARNSIDSAWATGAGIRVRGVAGLTEARAIIVDNDVNMPAPEGTVFGATSAGIEIRAFAQGNMVLNNRLRGRGAAALAVVAPMGAPANNTFVMNDVSGFQSSAADVLVTAGASGTLVVGTQGAVTDNGADTLIVPRTF
jgi:hypothetical protein